MKYSYFISVALVLISLSLKSQTDTDIPTASFELNIGSMRPMGVYADNIPKAGLLDIGIECQISVKRLFMGDKQYFPLSVGMKLGYNYYTLEKEESNNKIWDTTGTINWWRSEFKYTLRSHALNFHPFLELSSPQDKRLVAYIKGYFGPTTSWASSKLRHIAKDSLGGTIKNNERLLSVNRWTFDYGYKVGIGISLNPTYLTLSYTRIWGGEIEYVGKGSVKSFDPTDPSNIEIEPVRSVTDRYIIQIGIKHPF